MRRPHEQAKPLVFVADAEDDIAAMPRQVKRGFGFNLRTVQQGQTPENASPFEGSHANEVMKLSERHDGNTYRCVYAAKFENAVYVLHVFQKKSNVGIATPQKDIDLVYTRLAAARAHHAESYGKEK